MVRPLSFARVTVLTTWREKNKDIIYNFYFFFSKRSRRSPVLRCPKYGRDASKTPVLETRNPKTGDPEDRDPKTSDPETRDPKISDPKEAEVQEAGVQEARVQEAVIQEARIQAASTAC